MIDYKSEVNEKVLAQYYIRNNCDISLTMRDLKISLNIEPNRKPSHKEIMQNIVKQNYDEDIQSSPDDSSNFEPIKIMNKSQMINNDSLMLHVDNQIN